MDKKYSSCRAIIIEGKKILLMHRKKDGIEYWVYPGGHLEEGETPDQAMIREIWEELSLKVKKISKPHPYIHEFGTHEYYFECEVEDGEPKLDPSGTEKITDIDWYNPEWVDLSKAKTLENLYPNVIMKQLDFHLPGGSLENR
ncbi:MAG: NUDIX domain-containing protein [Candidatus Amesbacteria bacterium]|nr:NUDIX domain-containing protein [Candidatus Amesbacteria bacterium]